MVVTYIGPDTEDKPILLEGFHDEIDDQPPVKEAPEGCEGDEEGIYSPGFIASYWFFEKGTNFDGYKTDNVEPNLVKVTESINFENDASFKQESAAFPNDHFSCQWEGVIQIKKAGKYTFTTKSDDGSRLWVNDRRIVNNWGLHGARTRQGFITLTEGFHQFKAVHFENGGGASMVVKFQGPDTDNQLKLLSGAHEGKILKEMD
jgi:hypothetical protein